MPDCSKLTMAINDASFSTIYFAFYHDIFTTLNVVYAPEPLFFEIAEINDTDPESPHSFLNIKLLNRETTENRPLGS